VCEPRHSSPIPSRLTPVTTDRDRCYRRFPRATPQCGQLMGRSARSGRLTRTHWHAMDRECCGLILSPQHLRKAGRRGSCPLRKFHQQEAAASVEALDERRLGFSTRRPGQGRKGLRVPAAALLTLNEDSPPERLAPRCNKDRALVHRTRPALFILNPVLVSRNQSPARASPVNSSYV
jgi:hypothetical protein